MFCTKCGKEIENGTVCPVCGEDVDKAVNEACAKNWAAAYLFNIFLGYFGVHRFYTGYIGIGIAQLLTLGGFGIWTFIDGLALSFNLYQDSNGVKPEGHNNIAGIVGFIFGVLRNLTTSLIILFYICMFIIIGIAAVFGS